MYNNYTKIHCSYDQKPVHAHHLLCTEMSCVVMAVMPPSTAGDGREPAQRYWPACDVRREPKVRVLLVGSGCAVTSPEVTAVLLEYNQLAVGEPISPEIFTVMEQVAEYDSPIMAAVVTEPTLAEIAPVGTAQRERKIYELEI